MIAVHPSLVTDDPLAFIADKGYAMPFATDDDTVLDIVGSTGPIPRPSCWIAGARWCTTGSAP